MKPKELKPKEEKPIKYSDCGDYSLKKLAEIRKHNQPINFLDLTYKLKGTKIDPISFIKFKGPNQIFKSTYNSDIAVEDVEKEQTELKCDLNHINQGPRYNKSPEQLNTNK